MIQHALFGFNLEPWFLKLCSEMVHLVVGREDDQREKLRLASTARVIWISLFKVSVWKR